MKNVVDPAALMDFLSVGILLTAVAMNGLRRIESCVRTYFINSCFLSLLILVVASQTGSGHLYLAALITFLSKGVAIPLFLRRIVQRMGVTHDADPYLSNALSLAIAGILVGLVYASLREGIMVAGFARNVLQISIAVLLLGLFIMITRRKALTQVVGLLFMENGLFLAGFSLTLGMPLIIELGVLFDMMVGVIILGVFAVQIKREFLSTDLDRLTTLKG